MPPQTIVETSTSPEVFPELLEPVRKSIHVRANQGRAFKVFTEGMDSWWPRTHHIGSSPMTKVVIEGKVGGRCYSEQEDGSLCPWGTVLAWEPPLRYVMAWQITPAWQFEPELGKCSEVEVRFVEQPDGSTLVELEHRKLERHAAGCETMRASVDSTGGWSGLLAMYKAKADGAFSPLDTSSRQ